MAISDNVKRIKETLPEGVKLIAVTKLHSVEEIRQAYDAGLRDFGENKVQELLSKYDSFPDVRWHLIGHLQTNKVRQIVDKVEMIHSVDSYHLAEEIDKRAGACGRVVKILVQVNVAKEESKSGVYTEDLPELLEKIKNNLSNVELHGLMQIAPAAENPEDVRKYFKTLYQLYKGFKDTYNFDTLSMGMSGDYMTAVEEGSNAVRIGTAIFGERDYTK